jgi:hypothetical protein
LGQHDVEHDDVGRLAHRELEHPLSARCLDDLVSGDLEAI